jgi:hypothetical protein
MDTPRLPVTAVGRIAEGGMIGDPRRIKRNVSAKIHRPDTTPVHQPKNLGRDPRRARASSSVGALITVVGGMGLSV